MLIIITTDGLTAKKIISKMGSTGIVSAVRARPRILRNRVEKKGTWSSYADARYISWQCKQFTC